MNRLSRQAVVMEHVPLREVFWQLDPWLIGCLVALISVGLVMMTSASVSVADRTFTDPLHYFWRQVLALVLGLGSGLWVLTQPTERWYQLSGWLLAFGIVSLVLVLIPGLSHDSHGSSRWLKLGPVSFQASEPTKLFFVIYLAGYLVRHSDEVKYKMMGLVKPVVVVMVIGTLLLLEPDFGVTSVLLATTLGMVFLAGVSVLRFVAWSLAGVAVMALLLICSPYRLARLQHFIDPFSSATDKGFQLVQALIAFGRGEWFGVGLGGSIQKLHYLPEAHNDFVLAVLAEEFGFVGVVVVIALFGLLVWRAFAVAGKAYSLRRYFDAYLAYGIGLLLGMQAYVNAGVNMGLLPTKGLTLPFVSYGSNSMIVSCVAFALLLRVAFQVRDRVVTVPNEALQHG